MKFYTYTKITGDLIIIKTNIPTAPSCPVVAQSVPPAAPWVIRLVLWLISFFAPISLPSLITRLTVLAIFAMALVEVVAQSHIEKSLGVL